LLIDWWARDVNGKSSAVVLGSHALITITPTVNAAGKPAHEFRVFPVDEHTFRTASVTERTSGKPTGTAPKIEPGSPLANHHVGLSTRLDPDMAGFIGHFPARAQHLLQEPFLAAVEDKLWSDYYYVRHRAGDAHGPIDLSVWAYLANSKDVTFLAGIGHGHDDLSGPIWWELKCWRATVTRAGSAHS
jgi:hypothetical protein